ncbi:IclR family transcriptional regulator [Pseudoroseomonas wenyumeiae]|uniref:IclR family transcriptional regulator n=1 Tax=Teichococcus wenyumeiae TaxID=2478470 RepID=A0A3A9JBP2_9PROT|nr:IclR family transcriptional regulator [Pseudoroseomonas wenyumeiae]RKK02901.1 IclR family transcriptional regulator [Pseudoroseomonas wenyumeiae]RMI20202.1 IclR family transcriptional regulator [Pseudoroseomonas wenyumeiae]
MPKKSQRQSSAEANAAPGGTAAVDRALSILNAFTPERPQQGLAELAARTGLYKSTTLRLLASLEHAQFVQRLPDGTYCLGAACGRLHAAYAASFRLDRAVLPVLEELVRRTGESAAYHVLKGSGAEAVRVCLYRVDSPHPIRDHIRAGDILPLRSGTGGRVLLAFSAPLLPLEPEERELLAQIRQRGYHAAVGDRLAEVAGISAPVFHADGTLAAAVTLTMPGNRYQEAFIGPVLEAARALSRMV